MGVRVEIVEAVAIVNETIEALTSDSDMVEAVAIENSFIEVLET